MKRLKNILILIVAISLFASCEKQEKVTLGSEPVAPVLLTPAGGYEYVLTEENADNPFETFIYEAADHGVPLVLDYTVELDIAGGDFANAVSMQEPLTTLYQTISNGDFNLKMAALGLTPEEKSNVQVRVKAESKNEEVPVLYSNVVELVVTPYDATPPSLWLVGNATEADWSPQNAIEIKPIDLTKYEGVAKLTASPNEWRFLWQNTGWNPGLFFGDFNTVEGAKAAPENEYGEINFIVEEDGEYKIEINLDNKSLKLTKQ